MWLTAAPGPPGPGRGTVASFLEASFDLGPKRSDGAGPAADPASATTATGSSKGGCHDQLSESHVRVLVFGQTRHQTRKLLYDTMLPGAHQSAGSPRPAKGDSPGSPVSRRSPRKAKHEDLLSEMVFGSIPAALACGTIKLHQVVDPQQLVLSTLFDGFCFDPSDVGPPRRTPSPAASPVAAPGSPDPLSIMARHRHFFEEQIQIGAGAVNAANSPPRHERPAPSKPDLLIGMSVVVDTSGCAGFDAFARQHLTMIERLLLSLREKVLPHTKDLMTSGQVPRYTGGGHSPLGPRFSLDDLAAAIQGDATFNTAAESLRSQLRTFYTAPRLHTPGWLALATRATDGDGGKATMASHITTLLQTLKRSAKSKSFMAKALTAVLSYHTGWISTVTRARPWWSGEHAPLRLGTQRELYGLTAFPSDVTRTIVVGKDVDLVRQILRVLSYFIRCSTVTPEHSAAAAPPDGADHRARRGSLPAVDLTVTTVAVGDYQRVLLEPPDGDVEQIADHDPIVEAFFGDVCPTLVPFLVLQGLAKMPTMRAVADDLTQQCSHSVVGCAVDCARCVFIDVDKWSVDVVDVEHSASGELTYRVDVLEEPAAIVLRAMRGFLGCAELGLPPQVCLEYLESTLHEMCIASDVLTLAEDVGLDTADSSPVGIDSSDVALLEAIARFNESAQFMAI